MYQAFLLLFWWIFECIKRFCHFFGGFSNVSNVFVIFLVDFRMHEATGDRGPETGDREPETGDRGPDAGDLGPGTGDRAPGAGK